ncbi:MAG: hypothetical protein QM758_09335 [Armatimonas sp.]
MKCISRKDDSKILAIRQLIDQRQVRDRGRRFWCEGLRFAHKALNSHFAVSEVVAAPELFTGQVGWRLLDLARERGARVTFVTKAVFQSLSEAPECRESAVLPLLAGIHYSICRQTVSTSLWIRFAHRGTWGQFCAPQSP